MTATESEPSRQSSNAETLEESGSQEAQLRVATQNTGSEVTAHPSQSAMETSNQEAASGLEANTVPLSPPQEGAAPQGTACGKHLLMVD